MRKVVQPPGTLRFVPDGKKELIAFSKQYGLRNEYFKLMLDGKRREHLGWQRLAVVKWLQHVETGEIVVVVDGATRFINSVAAERDDMPFDPRNLQLLLIGKYCDGNGKPLDDYHKWRVLEQEPAGVWHERRM